MNYLSNLKSLTLSEKINPGKAPTGGDVGWLVDCKGAEFTKLAHLGHYLPNIPSPWALWAYEHARKTF